MKSGWYYFVNSGALGETKVIFEINDEKVSDMLIIDYDIIVSTRNDNVTYKQGRFISK